MRSEITPLPEPMSRIFRPLLLASVLGLAGHLIGVAMKPRRDIGLRLSTCVPGVSESIEAWQLARATPFGLRDVQGALLPAPGGPVTLFVKRTPAAAACGGIGTWAQPAAQLGASFLLC